MKYYDKFRELHELLKRYGCKPTFKWEKEYEEPADTAFEGTFFYCTLEDDKKDSQIRKEWKETVDARIDVVLPTSMQGALRGEIRFDIDYSERVDKYSMYISLPTHAKSIGLSKDIYKSQTDVIAEVQKWIITAKCKLIKEEKKKVEQRNKAFEQIALF